MTKDVIITICGLQAGPETDGEPIEMITTGEYFYKNNKHIQTQFNWLIEKQRQLYWNTQSSLFLFIPYFDKER